MVIKPLNQEEQNEFIDHFCYEWKMMRRARYALEVTQEDGFFRNCLIEVFVLHAVSIIEFFENKKGYFKLEKFIDISRYDFDARIYKEFKKKAQIQIRHLVFLKRTKIPEEKITVNEIFQVCDEICDSVIQFRCLLAPHLQEMLQDDGINLAIQLNLSKAFRDETG